MAGLFSSTIRNFAATPAYESWGVVVYGNSLLTLNGNAVSDYTRDGINAFGDGGAGADPNVTVSGNTVTGSSTPLNGIAIEDGASAVLTGNTVTGHTRSSPWAAVGLLVWGSDGVTISSNQISGNFYGIDLATVNGATVSANSLTNNISRAISLDDSDNNTVSGNTITGPAGGTDDVAIGLASGATGNTIGGANPAAGNAITMATVGAGNLYAVYVQADVGVGSNTIRHNTIQGAKRAVQIDPGNSGTTTVSDNTIGGSTAPSSHFLISEENELALFWYLSGEFVDQTRAGFRVVKSGVG